MPTLAIAQEAESEHPDDHHIHPHHVAVFLGAATPKKAKSDTSFALGFEYERRFNDWIGAGGLADFLFGDFNRNALAAGAVFFHPPLGELTFLFAPGAEWVEKAVVEGQDIKQKNEAFFVLRLGASYPFHVGAASITPMFNVDLIGETKTTFTYGVSFGYGF